MALQYVLVQLSPTGGPPTARAGHVSWVVGNFAYVFGGYESYRFPQFDYNLCPNNLWSYNIINNTWAIVSTNGNPSVRTGAAAWTFDSKLYLFGGSTFFGTSTLNDLWCYDTTTSQWTQLSPSINPTARAYATTWQCGQYFYMTGGTSQVIVSNLNSNIDDSVLSPSYQDTWVFDCSNQTWQQLSDAFYPFYAGTAWKQDSDVFISTGLSGNTVQIFQFNCATNNWMSQTPTTLQSFTTAITPVNHNASFLIGGAQGTLAVPYVFAFGTTNNVLIYQGATLDTQLPNIPFAARYKTTVWATAENKIYLFGGGNPQVNGNQTQVSNPQMYNDLWQLTIQSIEISDLQVPSIVYAGSSLNVSFLVNVQNGSGSLQTVLNWNNTNYAMTDMPVFTTTLPSPAIGSDYLLTITTYDPVFPNLSDVQVKTIHVVQLLLSGALIPNLVGEGDPYTISWTTQVVNPQPNIDPVVVNVLKPEGLSANHYGTDQIQALAPLVASDYPITITACISDSCISDILLLHVVKIIIEAGDERVITYGTSTQLGVPNVDPALTFSWLPSDTLDNAHIATPTAWPLITTTYILTEFRSDINRYASDSVIIHVEAPIAFSDVNITPPVTYTSGSDVHINWHITPSIPTPNYHITIHRSDGSIAWSSDYSGALSGTAIDAAPSMIGVYPYYLSVVRSDYGQLSDNAVVHLSVLQAIIPHESNSDLIVTIPPVSRSYFPSIVFLFLVFYFFVWLFLIVVVSMEET